MSDLDVALISAAMTGDQAEVQRLLDEGANPNVSIGDSNPMTALVGAVFKNADDSVVETIMRAKGEVARWPIGEAEVLVSHAIGSSRPGLLKELLHHGASPNGALVADGPRLLHLALAQNEIECGQVLLEAGAHPDDCLDGVTPIHLATVLDQQSWLKWAEILHAAGANLEARGGDGGTALIRALDMERFDAAIWLLEHGADPFAQEPASCMTALHTAAVVGGLDVVRWILDAMDTAGIRDPDVATSRGWTPLHFAAEKGHREVALLLLRRGASPVISVGERAPSVYEAGAGVASPVFSAAFAGRIELALEMLAEYFGEASRPRAADELLNRIACRIGDEGAVQLLLAAGADPARLDPESGWAPIHWAAYYGNVAAIRALIAGGAQPDQSGANGLTALLIAEARDEKASADALRSSGADPVLAARILSDIRGQEQDGGTALGGVLLAAGVAALAHAATSSNSHQSRDRTPTLLAAAGGALAGAAVMDYLDRSKIGQVIGRIDGDAIRAGEKSWDPIVFHIDGDRVIRGEHSWGDIVATIDGIQVREGDKSWGDVLATISGCQVRAGSQSWGDVVATIRDEQVLLGSPAWVSTAADGDMIRAGALAAALVLL